MSSDLRFDVGGRRLVLPVVALPGASSGRASFSLDREGDASRDIELREHLRSEAAARRHVRRDAVEVAIFMFGGYGDLLASRAICPRLQRRWSRMACDDSRDPLIAAMPRNTFWLVDLTRLGLFDEHTTIGGERVGDQLRSMGAVGETATVACDRNLTQQGERFCQAVVRIDDRLGAVWSVWEGERHVETAAQMARREGQAIRALVRYGLGAVEDYRDLLAAACQARRPEPHRSDFRCVGEVAP